MISFLGRLEDCAKKSKLTLRNLALRHGEANAELCRGNVARSESIEVAEELRDADSLLLRELADASDHIVHVVGAVAHDLSLALAGLGLWEIVDAMVEALVDSEELL